MAKPTLRRVELLCPIDQTKLWAIDGPEKPTHLGLTCPECGWTTAYDLQNQCYTPEPPLATNIVKASTAPEAKPQTK